MPDTTVTGAKEMESPAIKSDENPSRGGDHAQKTSEQLLSEYKAENQRKAEENKVLKSEMQEMKSTLAELKEKAEAGELSKRDEGRMENLEDEIKDAAKKLRGQKETQPWIEIAREEMTVSQAQFQIELGNEYIEDKASDLGIEPKDLAKEIAVYAFKYQDKRPARRNELAFRDWKNATAKQKELEAKETAIKERDAKDASFREGRGRNPRQADKNQSFQDANKDGRLDILRDLIG